VVELYSQLKPPIALVDNDGLNEVETRGYRRYLKCFYCDSKFRSLKHLQAHHSLKHLTWNADPKVRFSYVVVNERYILAQLKQCRTKTLVFSHRYSAQQREALINDCKEIRVIKNSCWNRNCPKCLPERRARYTKKYKESLLNFKRVSVVTLTYHGYHVISKNKKQLLEKHLRNFIKRLQRRTLYKLQYIRVLEMVKKDRGYYYHYHFLFDLPFIKQGVLSKLWHETTKTSFVVDIRILRDNKNRPVGIFWNRLTDEEKLNHTCNYITKYLAKPLNGIPNSIYASNVYGVHFVETHLTRLRGQNSSKKYEVKGIICEKCGDRFKFSHEIVIPHDHSPPKLADYVEVGCSN
jgi:hypothetical protein